MRSVSDYSPDRLPRFTERQRETTPQVGVDEYFDLNPPLPSDRLDALGVAVQTVGDVPTEAVYPSAISFELDPTPGPELTPEARDETVDSSTVSGVTTRVVTRRASTGRRPQTVRRDSVGRFSSGS